VVLEAGGDTRDDVIVDPHLPELTTGLCIESEDICVAIAEEHPVAGIALAADGADRH